MIEGSAKADVDPPVMTANLSRRRHEQDQGNVVTEHEVAMLYREATPNRRPRPPRCTRLSRESACAVVHERLPCLDWLPKYSPRESLGMDVLAGVTIGVILIPQGLSYGLLAGLPAQYGLYVCLVAPLVYCMMGTCTQLHIGPFALISLLVVNTVSEVVDPDQNLELYIDAVMLCSILVGTLLIVMGLLRLGSVVHFLAAPVMSGLTTGGAFLITTSQMGSFLGLSVPRGKFFPTWGHILQQLPQVNVASLLIGCTSLAALLVWRELKTSRLVRKWRLTNTPMALVVMVLATIVTWAAALDERYGVRVLGEIPVGVPAPRVPSEAVPLAGELMVPAVIISLVGYALSMATSKTFASKNKYEVNSNQELYALGMANLLGGLFNGHPAFSSLSRSALADALGAKSPLHNVVSSLMVVVVITLLTTYLEKLPYPCLAAIIFDSLKSLYMQLFELKGLWRTDKRDMLIWLVTFFAVLILDVALGLGVGVAYSVAVLLYMSSTPTYAVIGRLPKLPWLFKDLARFPEAKPVPGLLVFRFDSTLHFANADNFRAALLAAAARRNAECRDAGDRLHSVVLDASAISDCDTSALKALAKVQAALHRDGVELILCTCRGRFRGILRRSDIRFQEYVSLQDGVAYAEGKILMEQRGMPSPISMQLAQQNAGGAPIVEDETEADETDAEETEGVESDLEAPAAAAAAVPPPPRESNENE